MADCSVLFCLIYGMRCDRNISSGNISRVLGLEFVEDILLKHTDMEAAAPLMLVHRGLDRLKGFDEERKLGTGRDDNRRLYDLPEPEGLLSLGSR